MEAHLTIYRELGHIIWLWQAPARYPFPQAITSARTKLARSRTEITRGFSLLDDHEPPGVQGYRFGIDLECQ